MTRQDLERQWGKERYEKADVNHNHWILNHWWLWGELADLFRDDQDAFIMVVMRLNEQIAVIHDSEIR